MDYAWLRILFKCPMRRDDGATEGWCRSAALETLEFRECSSKGNMPLFGADDIRLMDVVHNSAINKHEFFVARKVKNQ